MIRAPCLVASASAPPAGFPGRCRTRSKASVANANRNHQPNWATPGHGLVLDGMLDVLAPAVGTLRASGQRMSSIHFLAVSSSGNIFVSLISEMPSSKWSLTYIIPLFLDHTCFSPVLAALLQLCAHDEFGCSPVPKETQLSRTLPACWHQLSGLRPWVDASWLFMG